MASIPGAMFKTVKIHDEIRGFRKRSTSNAPDVTRLDGVVTHFETQEFRQRSVSMTSTPPKTPSTTGSLTPVSGLSPSISGDSLRNLVGGFMGSLSMIRPKQLDSSFESVNEEFPNMRSYPNAGSITDLAHMK